MKPNNSKPAEQVVAAIRALDLDPIKVKLMDAEEGQGWSREYADRVEIGYKQFLTLLVTRPETTIAPNKEIDKFWHAHILDTMKYADDCQNVFGYFLHHFPYFGMRSAEDAAQLEQASRDTQRLFADEFNDTMPDAASHCMAAQPQAKTAHCMAAVADVDAAHCMAAQPQSSVAHCMSAVTATGPAHCMAASPAQGSAHCMAAVADVDAAHCMAAQPQSSVAHCMSAVTATGPTHCMAASPLQGSAHCMASVSEWSAAHCMAAKPDIRARPALAQAA
jgi:hypothetical protein